MNVYDIGAEVEIRGIFTSRKLTTAEAQAFEETGELPKGVGVDPGEVTCVVVDPAGATSKPEANGGGGVYVALVDVTQAGEYKHAMYGKGEFKAAKRGSFKGAKPLPSA